MHSNNYGQGVYKYQDNSILEPGFVYVLLKCTVYRDFAGIPYSQRTYKNYYNEILLVYVKNENGAVFATNDCFYKLLTKQPISYFSPDNNGKVEFGIGFFNFVGSSNNNLVGDYSIEKEDLYITSDEIITNEDVLVKRVDLPSFLEFPLLPLPSNPLFYDVVTLGFKIHSASNKLTNNPMNILYWEDIKSPSEFTWAVPQLMFTNDYVVNEDGNYCIYSSLDNSYRLEYLFRGEDPELEDYEYIVLNQQSNVTDTVHLGYSLVFRGHMNNVVFYISFNQLLVKYFVDVDTYDVEL